MSSAALEFDGVWKKFTKGEKFDCLRDLIPAAVKGLFSGNDREELNEREFWALKDVSFKVRRGEALGIIGHNGSGKSTTLKLLSGILKPTKGNIKVNGRLSALIEVAAGFHPDLTGRENIYLNGTILGMRRAEIDRKFDEIVDFSGLEEFIDTPVKRYSSGMYARLGFSVAAYVDPDILLVDEVLSVGDMNFQKRCLEKMHEKIRSDVAVIFVSHNLTAVSNLCTRGLLLNKGSLLFDGSCASVLEAYVETMKLSDSRAGAGEAKIRIVEAEFQISGRPKPSAAKPHDICELKVSFQCVAQLPQFNVGLIIRRTQDLYYCYGATTEQLGYPLFECQPGERLTVRFQFHAHLTRGHYRIDLNLRDPRGAAFLLQSDGVASFTIDEQVSQDGVVDIGLSVIAQECSRSREIDRVARCEGR